jgi:hypothetical protein
MKFSPPRNMVPTSLSKSKFPFNNVNNNLNNNQPLKFKKQFRQLNYYSMPNSTLFVVRKRTNFIMLISWLIFFIFFSFL